MTADQCPWLAAQLLAVRAREQVTIAMGMIDVVDREMAPLENDLRTYARRQRGCKAVMRHYGIGELIAVTNDHGRVMHEPVDERSGDHRIAEDFAPQASNPRFEVMMIEPHSSRRDSSPNRRLAACRSNGR
jgi:hypothetical protein